MSQVNFFISTLGDGGDRIQEFGHEDVVDMLLLLGDLIALKQDRLEGVEGLVRNVVIWKPLNNSDDFRLELRYIPSGTRVQLELPVVHV